MCGIVAVIARTGEGLAPAEAMVAALTHRGPDEQGFFVDPASGVALGMRRLSIVDLEGGHQPMWDERGSIGLVFNGEIYNHQQLRRELQQAGHAFGTDHSDTEVLVHGYEQWGTDLFERLNGMFAVAIWDARHRHLVVARDRIGEKPLYIATLPHGFAIASEMKALFQHPGISRRADITGVAEYLAFDFVRSPRTTVEGIQKLPPGHFAILDDSAASVKRYWTPTFEPAMALTDTDNILQELDDLLASSVRMRMSADVPVALLLSGGLDSSTVGWYMAQRDARVESYSIGFDDRVHDETDHAVTVAGSIGIRHHSERLTGQAVLEKVFEVTSVLDEPMADQSILPALLLSQVVSAHVKVALGGDGADELLMGYRTFKLLKAMSALDSVSTLARRVLPVRAAQERAATAGGLSRAAWHVLGAVTRQPEERLFAWRGSFGGLGTTVLANEAAGEAIITEVHAARPGSDYETRLVAAYLSGYLPEDILVKVDRASMAHSLEVRSPFLDTKLVDFLLRLPPALKRGKAPLRKLMAGRLPSSALARQKHGFSVPMAAWLRGPLRELVTDVLSHQAIREGGLLSESVATRLLSRHLTGRADHSRQLWSMCVLARWQRQWGITAA